MEERKATIAQRLREIRGHMTQSGSELSRQRCPCMRERKEFQATVLRSESQNCAEKLSRKFFSTKTAHSVKNY